MWGAQRVWPVFVAGLFDLPARHFAFDDARVGSQSIRNAASSTTSDGNVLASDPIDTKSDNGDPTKFQLSGTRHTNSVVGRRLVGVICGIPEAGPWVFSSVSHW